MAPLPGRRQLAWASRSPAAAVGGVVGANVAGGARNDGSRSFSKPRARCNGAIGSTSAMRLVGPSFSSSFSSFSVVVVDPP